MRLRFGCTLLAVCDCVWVCVITCKTSILMPFMRTHTYTPGRPTPGPAPVCGVCVCVCVLVYCKTAVTGFNCRFLYDSSNFTN